MLKKHTNLYSYINACISCFLMSTGFGILTGIGFNSQLSIKEVMIQILITCILMTVIVFNRFTAIFGAVLGAAGIFYGFSLLNIKENGGFNSLFNWLITQMPEDSVWYSIETMNLIHTIINIAICVAMFLIWCTPYRSRLTALISLAMIILIYITGTTQYNRIVILLIFTGVFSICAVDKYENRRHLGSKKRFSVLGERWIVPFVSMLLCILLSGSTLIMLDNDNKYDFRNRTCSQIAADVQSYSGVYTAEQMGLNLTLYDLGLQENEKYIGGNLPEREHFLLATTDLNKSYNVKVTTFDKFTGKKWITTFTDNYRVNGPFRKKQRQCLANNFVTSSDYIRNLNNIIFSKKVNIVLNIDSMFLPTIGQTYKYIENSKSKNPNLFNRSGQLFSYFGQKQGYSYTLNTIHFNTNARLSEKNLTQINELMVKRDPMYTKKFVSDYTNFPVKFGRTFNDLIKMMGVKSKNKFEVACKVNNFFSEENGFKYSTEGLDFDSDTNIVNEVFTTKKGHCVYYSTAAIAVLRYLKIPCRLAAGYKTIRINDNLHIVDSHYPYCWVECYFPNLGWISFDPSPENEIEFDAEMLSIPNESTTDIKGENKTEEIKKDTSVTPQIAGIPLNVLWVVLLVLFTYLILRGFLANKLYDYKFVVKRFKTNQKQCEYYLKDIQRQFSIIDEGRHIQETLREQIADIYSVLDEKDKMLLISAIEICESFCYGGNIPNDQEIQQVCLARSMLDNVLKKKSKLITYILKRRIFLPVI